MKSFSFLKLPVLLLGLGACVVFTPVCKAQAEVNPDHFDGTESWAVAAPRPVLVAKTNHLPSAAALQAKNEKTAGPTLKLSSARDVQNPLGPEGVAIQDKRKATASKTDKK
jgi:hypothetical protein